MSVAHDNWLNPSHKKCGICPSWASRKMINKQESRALHQKMRHPQLLLLGPFRAIRKKIGTKGQPQAMFLRIMPPQDNPHGHSHAVQMAIKMNIDTKIRPWCYIPAYPHKRANCFNMHQLFWKSSLSLTTFAFWNHTHNGIIQHHEWVRNRPW